MFENSAWIRTQNNMGDVCPVFKKEFCVNKKISRVILHITAMGVYEAHINKNRVGDFVLAPGWTIYNKRHLYQSYDITRDIITGKNILEVTVGKGWYRGRLTEFNYVDAWGHFSGLIAQVDISYADGSNETIVSDREWKAAEGPIRFSELYDGEIYDSRIESENWESAEEFLADKSILFPTDGEKVIEQEHIKAVDIIITPNGERVIDFGQNLTGYVELKLTADCGTVIKYSHAEELDSDGNFYTNNLRSAKQTVEYICNGGLQIYKPKFTFMGFRYIRLDECPEDISKDNFTAIAVYSDMKRTGSFACSNELVNKLYSNIIWGQKGNFLDIPTDCPQRDERLGWAGDAQVFAETASYNFNVDKFFTKWLRDLSAGQLDDGRVPHVIPDILNHGDAFKYSGSAGWGDAVVICPWQMYLTYANKNILKEMAPAMKKWIDYIRSQGDNEYLWNTGKHFGDWLGLDAPQGSYKGSSRDDFIATAFYAYSTGIFTKVLEILGEDNSEYKNLYEQIVKEFNRQYKPVTQTEHVISLYFNIAENPKETAKNLAKLVMDNNNKLTTGFLGTPYLLSALSDNGYTDLAYTLLLQEESPSWLFSVKRGATTIWEHWDGIKEDGSFWSDEMNSFNHYAYGAVGAWLYNTAAGIRRDENSPGFSHIILEPHPDERFEWLEASIDTEYGMIRAKWFYENGKAFYEFDIPTKATVSIEGKTYELCSGSYRF